jgi:hypothetical protein
VNNLKYTTNANKFNPHFVTGFFDNFTNIKSKFNRIIQKYITSLTFNFIPFLELNLEKFYLNNKKTARCLFTSSSNKNLSLVV